MTTLVLALFTIAWALVVFMVIRALLIVTRQDRRLATAAAVAVAGAFAVGALSPFSLWTHGAGASPTTPVAAAAAPAPQAPAPAAVRAVVCPPQVHIAGGGAMGHVDAEMAGGKAQPSGTAMQLAHGKLIQLGGWIVAAGATPATDFCVISDSHTVPANEQYGLDRPDVATALARPDDRATGFDATFTLPAGSHTIAIGVVEADGETVHLLAPSIRAQVR